MNGQPLFIVWTKSSERAETLARELGGHVSYNYEAQLDGKSYWLKPLRWLVQGWKTWRVLEREQPEVVLVQGPPVFAILVVSIWCWLKNRYRPSGRSVRYVIDAHTGTFHCHNWRWSVPLLRLLARPALATLVTDDAALCMLKDWQARGFFLITALPRLKPPAGDVGTQGETRVAVISTFAETEPIAEVFAAARLLPQVTFYVTGDTKLPSPTLLVQKPENVTLTGFLRGGNYTALLKNVHGLVVLTTEVNALSHGGYEAVVMQKPAVVSNGPEMRRIFTRGFLHVENTPDAIAAAITQMLNEQETMTDEILTMRSELTNKRQLVLEEFIALLKGQDLLSSTALSTRYLERHSSLERL
jgi:glycosyltransferase involved in cell wall biosynthesis